MLTKSTWKAVNTAPMRWQNHWSRVSCSLQCSRYIRTRARISPSTSHRLEQHIRSPNAPSLSTPMLVRADDRNESLKDTTTVGSDATTNMEAASKEVDVSDGPETSTPEPTEKQPGASLAIPNSILEYWSDISAPTFEQRRMANRFFTGHPQKMLFSAGSLYQVRFTDVPEVAIIGRSNVGKSSIVNALLGNKVAHTSARPGKTKTLNAWAVGGMDRTGRKHRLTVLDMPGYGHGSRQAWGDNVTRYLQQRKELKRVFVLVNADHEIKQNDKAMLKSLREARVPHQVVLAKVDQVITAKENKLSTKMHRICSKSNLQRASRKLAVTMDLIPKEKSERLPSAMRDIIACSGLSQGLRGERPEPQGSLGITALRWAILNAAGLHLRRVADESELNFS